MNASPTVNDHRTESCLLLNSESVLLHVLLLIQEQDKDLNLEEIFLANSNNRNASSTMGFKG